MSISGAGQTIHSQVSQWEGVTSAPHRFGGTEFKVGGREIGHIHGDSLVDIPFPKRIRDELVAAGKAEPHHVRPQSGWVSIFVNEPGDVDRAGELLRRSYELAQDLKQRRERRKKP